MIGALLRRHPDPPLTVAEEGPLWVELSTTQSHPVDLCWVDELMSSARPHLMVRPEDELLILVPNRPIKVNRTALRVLAAQLDEGVGIAEVLRREGDTAECRRQMHYFFTDLQDWLKGTLGEGVGRLGTVREAFQADFSRYPVLAEVALTYRCNLSCDFCYAGCAAAGLPEGWSESRTMSDADVHRALDRIWGEARCPSVSFTGGEPTLRPALPEFVRHAKVLGMKVNLISNGSLLDERRVGALAAAGLDSAQLSLEGPTAEVHDGLVNRSGAFARLWGAVERLQAHNVRAHTNTTVNRSNLEHLEEIVDLVAAQGMSRFTMNLIIPCGAAAGSDDLWIAYSDVGDALLRVKTRAEERGVRFIWYSPIPMCRFNTAAHGMGAQGCAAADGLLHVNPAGDVLPCSSFQHGESLGNLLEQPFDEIWQSHEARFFRGKRMMPPGCEGCADNQICQGACPLYWREVGLQELGGGATDRPPMPAGLGSQIWGPRRKGDRVE